MFGNKVVAPIGAMGNNGGFGGWGGDALIALIMMFLFPMIYGGMGYSGRRDSRGRYSRDDGRSEMMEHLEAAWDTAPERDRETIRRFMDKLENA